MIDQFLIEFIHDHLTPNYDNFDGKYEILYRPFY